MSSPGLESVFRSAGDVIAFTKQSIEQRHFRLARKLYYQALIDFPESEAEMRPLFMSIHDAEDALRVKNHSVAGLPFDFVILPALRSGSTFLDTVLNLHPDLMAVPVSEFDESLMLKAPGRLLQKYHHVLANERRRAHKAGLVFHRFLLAPEHIQYSAKTASELCKSGRFLHVVRDPLPAFISELNHEIWVNFLGDYRLSALGLPWPARGPIPDGLPNKPQTEPLFDFLSKNRIYYSTVGKEFSKYFSKWEVLALEDLLPSNDYKGVAEVEKFCGAKKKIDPVFFNLPPNDWMKRLMEKNWFSVNVENNALPFGIGYAYETTLTPGAAAIELCRESAEAAKAKRRLPFCLAVRLHDWERLPEKIRTQLIRERPLAKLFESEFIPAWEANTAKWKSVADSMAQRELTADQRKKFIERTKPELQAFASAKPQIAKRWPIMSEL